MQRPPSVDVEIILDPYVANVFPQSLGITAVYILGLAGLALFVSGRLWQALAPSTESQEKKHVD